MVRALRERADQTPPSRERYVDLLRALAIGLVVLGHWLVSAITYDERGRPSGSSALDDLPWAFPITWVVQVLPLFFIIGGYANAASLTSHRRRGEDAVAWLHDRSGRLVRPTTTLLVLLAGAALVAQLLRADPEFARMAVWVASIPLWFLSAYLVVVVAAPLMYRLHQRFGWTVLAVLVLLVALGDVARWSGTEQLAVGNFLFGWLAIHQIGFAWRDGQLSFRPRVWAPVLLGGLAALLALTVAGPYSISMIDVSGQRLQNVSPPSLALLAVTAFQLGLVMSLRNRAERWLRRPRPWQVVVAINSIVFTVFLWHMTAVVILVGVLHALHRLPTPTVGTAAWWLWRVPWLLMLIVLLAVLVAVFGRLEVRPPSPRGGAWPAWLRRIVAHTAVRVVLTVAAFGAVVIGLVSNNLAPRSGRYAVGMPLAGLLAYLAGAAALRLLRSSLPRADGEPAPAGRRG